MADDPNLSLEIVIAKINQQYPAAMAILQQPGVFQVYANALYFGWSPDMITAQLQNTQWWKTTPDTQRQWQALVATDPATAADKVQLYSEQWKNIEQSLGIHFDQSEGIYSPDFALFNRAVTEGWDANRMRYEILGMSRLYQTDATGGEVAKNAADVKSMANDYCVPISDQMVMGWGKQLAQGDVSLDSLKGYMIENAKSLFPSLATALDQGVTVKQYADPYIQLAQQELNINPNDVQLTDKKWMNILNQVDPKTGARVSMSLDQALSTFRTDPTWGYDQTDKAKADATTLATQLQTKLGAAA